jgi:hypothetical protein
LARSGKAITAPHAPLLFGRQIKPAKVVFRVHLICYKRKYQRSFMADREKESKPKKENQQEEKLRDLPPKKDVKGGATKEGSSEKRRTGEIDFMQYLD